LKDVMPKLTNFVELFYGEVENLKSDSYVLSVLLVTYSSRIEGNIRSWVGTSLKGEGN